MKTDRKLNSWQKKLLDIILDAYERTGTYRGEAKKHQKLRVPAVEIYPAYERDDADLTELSQFEASMRALELFSPVRIVYKDSLPVMWSPHCMNLPAESREERSMPVRSVFMRGILAEAVFWMILLKSRKHS